MADGDAARSTRAASAADPDTVNQVVEAALRRWDLPERVLRLTLPSFRYSRDDLEHMHLVQAHDAGGRACGVAAWEAA